MPKEVHKGKVYAVANGRSPGVYNTWEEAEAQVRGFANNRFKSFSNPNEAAAFMQGYQAATREFDGASKNNPGPSGLGAVLYDKSTGAEVSRVCRYVGTKTNNEAEYLGVIAGMQEARRLGCQSIEIRGDSQLVINQIQDNWKVKADSLRPYHQTATDLYQSFPSRTAHHIPRELNKVADKLSNEAIRNYDQNVTKDVWTLQDAHGSSSSS